MNQQKELRENLNIIPSEQKNGRGKNPNSWKNSFKKGHKINLGRKHSPEEKILYGQKIKELWKNIEYRNKIINSLKGKKKALISLKHKLNLSLAHKGKHSSPQTEWKKGDIRISGMNNSNWQGGIAFEPYTKEFNKLFKLAIKQRDGFLCLKCGMKEEDAKILFNRRLVTHHIDYIKENTYKENCCALCIRCNAEVNTNRKQWTQFFQSILSERYGYDLIKIEVIQCPQ
jgi:hypothetical protein